jgi:hypothetical protein
VADERPWTGHLTTPMQVHVCEDGWICEGHPDRGWPHGDCAGRECRARSAIGNRRRDCRRIGDLSRRVRKRTEVEASPERKTLMITKHVFRLVVASVAALACACSEPPPPALPQDVTTAKGRFTVPGHGFIDGRVLAARGKSLRKSPSSATRPAWASRANSSTRSRFPVAVLSDYHRCRSGFSVRFRPISGRLDQAAGLVWRYRNQDNYYIVRANARRQRSALQVEGGSAPVYCRRAWGARSSTATHARAASVGAGRRVSIRIVEPPRTAWRKTAGPNSR